MSAPKAERVYYTYSFVSRIAFCLGPVDKLYGYKVERVHKTMNVTRSGDYYTFPSSGGCDQYDRGKLMSGRLYWGTDTQVSTDGILGHDLNYRGVCYFAGTFCLGTSPNPLTVVFDLYRKVQPLSELPYGSGDHLNPVQILFDILTNDYLLGIPTDLIDRDSFVEAGNILENEGIYISLVVRESNDLSRAIKTILEIIDGKLYWKDGKIALKLLRPESSSYTLDDSYLKDLQITGRTWAGVPCGVSIEWIDPDREFETNWIYITDPAAQACAQVFSLSEFSWDAIFTKEVAQKIAQRKLKLVTFPRLEARFVTRYPVSIFDVFTLSSSLYNFEGTFRVTSVLRRDNGIYEVEAVEEVELEAGTFVWQPEYAEVARETFVHDYPPYGIKENPFGNIFVWVERNASNPTLVGAEVCVYVTDRLIERREIPHAVIGTLKDPLPQNTYTSGQDLSIEAQGEWWDLEMASTDEEGWWNGTNVLLIDNEIIFAKDVEETTEGWRFTGLIRGAYGTEKASHSAGARVIRVSPGALFNISESYIGQSLDFTIVPLHFWLGIKIRDPDYAQSTTFSWQGLRYRPLPVHNLHANNSKNIVPISSDAQISWYLTSRNGGAGTTVAGSSKPGDGTPEHSKILLQIWNDSGSTLLREVELSSGTTSWTYTVDMQNADGVSSSPFRVKVFQVGTYESPVSEIYVTRS